eukprot:jgi/Chlat1/6876/Chrsp51S06573
MRRWSATAVQHPAEAMAWGISHEAAARISSRRHSSNPIPGPASAQQRGGSLGGEATQAPNHQANDIGRTTSRDRRRGPKPDTVFESRAWVSAMALLGLDKFDEAHPKLTTSVRRVVRDECGHRVPSLLVAIKHISVSKGNEAVVQLQDPTGKITGVFHPSVLSSPHAHLLKAGAVLGLTSVAVLSNLQERWHYLFIALPNVSCVIPAGSSDPVDLQSPSEAEQAEESAEPSTAATPSASDDHNRTDSEPTQASQGQAANTSTAQPLSDALQPVRASQVGAHGDAQTQLEGLDPEVDKENDDEDMVPSLGGHVPSTAPAPTSCTMWPDDDATFSPEPTYTPSRQHKATDAAQAAINAFNARQPLRSSSQKPHVLQEASTTRQNTQRVNQPVAAGGPFGGTQRRLSCYAAPAQPTFEGRPSGAALGNQRPAFSLSQQAAFGSQNRFTQQSMPVAAGLEQHRSSQDGRPHPAVHNRAFLHQNRPPGM